MVKLTANRVAKAIYKAKDPGNNQFLLLKAILDHWKEAAYVSKGDGWVKYKYSNPEWKKSTNGWGLLVQFEYIVDSWAKLEELKGSFRVQLADYTFTNE